MPVLDMAYASPRIPLPMIALLRLNTDIPNEVFPSNCQRHKDNMLKMSKNMQGDYSVQTRDSAMSAYYYTE